MKAIQIKHKLILGFLIVASLASVATVVALFSYQTINAAFVNLIDDPTSMVVVLNELKQNGLQIVSSTSEYVLIYDEAGIDKADLAADEEDQLRTKGVEAFRNSLKKYEQLTDSVASDEIVVLENIRSTGSKLIETSNEMVMLKKLNVRGNEILEKRAAFELNEKAYFKVIDDSLKKEWGEQLEGQHNVRSIIALATKATLVMTGLTFILAIFAGFYISYLMSRRIEKLIEAVRLVGTGELDTRIEIGPNDEIGDLAGSFNKMALDLKHSHDSMVASKNFADNVISSIADALFVVDMDLTVVRVNQAALDVTGFTDDELIGSAIKTLKMDEGFLDSQDINELLAKRYSKDVETSLTRKDACQVPILFSASLMQSSSGTNEGIVCVAHDISELKSLESQLTAQVLHDPMTKLANYVLFTDRVEHALARIDRVRSPMAVLFLDLDNFKDINDTVGRRGGDELLIAVAERLQICIRTSDTAARLGGDEFAVIVENTTDTAGALLVAERILNTLRPAFLIDGKEITIRASIGIATTGNGAEDPRQLLRNADVAMYMAKNQGKNRYVIFESEMDESVVKRVELGTEMRHAIDAEEFVLHYQPIVDLESGQIMGMEALTRWEHPTRGMISPLEFIPIAEETELIIPLGQWILDEACRQTRHWQTDHNCESWLSITVNISACQFQDESMIRMVSGALAKNDLAPGSLILEITETTMLENTEVSMKKLQKLREMGVRVAIDDFGTGYSSLSYLQQFPIDILKIDISFIDKVSQGKEGAAVARAIIAMSDTLNVRTIAEGIETAEQSITLQGLGCELGQGYYFARPLHKNEMNDFLRKSIEGMAKETRSGTDRAVVSATNSFVLPNPRVADRHAAAISPKTRVI